jgi:hypothetical protein
MLQIKIKKSGGISANSVPEFRLLLTANPQLLARGVLENVYS